MTQPVQEPTFDREISSLAFGNRQLFRRPGRAAGVLPRNVGEIIGMKGTNAQATTLTKTIEFQDVRKGDGIMVSAHAPSLPVALGTEGFPISCADTQGNTYTAILTRDYQASPPLVNKGAYTVLFYCQYSVAPLVNGVDTITVTWDNAVFDRSMYAWLVRHDGGANVPTVLASTASNDAAVYASTQVTLTAPNFTPVRGNALEFAMVLAVKTGGVGAFSSVFGYNGFFQAQFRQYAGTKQTYLLNVQTHGADVYLQVGTAIAQNEIDLGSLVGGVLVSSFNGVGQNYSLGANAWKGIRLLGLD